VIIVNIVDMVSIVSIVNRPIIGKPCDSSFGDILVRDSRFGRLERPESSRVESEENGESDEETNVENVVTYLDLDCNLTLLVVCSRYIITHLIESVEGEWKG
jgi:hypothetical protein